MQHSNFTRISVVICVWTLILTIVSGNPTLSFNTKETVLIVGAGPAGLSLALGLSRLGWKVRVFEKRLDLMTRGGAIVGVAPNGLKALEELHSGLQDKIMSLSQSNGPSRSMPWCTMRDVLLEEALKEKNIIIETGKCLEDIVEGDEGVCSTLKTKNGQWRMIFTDKSQINPKTGQSATISKIWIPPNIRNDVLAWYHAILCHPGQHTMIDTMSQHMFWRGMNKDIIKFIQTCPACQKRKSHRKTFAKLPLNLQAPKPWQVLSVDLVGPYKITDADKKKYELTALTMADPATGWFEIIELPHGHTGEQVALALDRTWFSRYPRPQICRFDNGREFVSAEFQELLESYGITPSPTTVKNPKANFVERVHQTLGNMLRTAELCA